MNIRKAWRRRSVVLLFRSQSTGKWIQSVGINSMWGVVATTFVLGEAISGMSEFTFYEFFARGGMARAGLGDE